MKPLKWGVLGAGKFAREQMAPAIHAARWAEFAAIATSDPAKAEPFADFRPGLTVYTDYDALLADPDIDAVYVPLPNHLHVEWALKAMDAGKHVLVEKPLAMSAVGFDPVIAKRDETGLHAAEAYMIVHHPQFQRARELVQSGAIGKLVHVDTAFSYNNASATENIRNRPETGGGALPDIGVYTFGAARFVTGEDPVAITHAHIRYENNVDVFNQIAAQFSSFTYSAVVSMRAFTRQEIVFHGETGILRVTCPFNANVHDQAELHLETAGHKLEVMRFPGVNQYVNQVENFARTVREGASYPCPLEFSQGTQAMIDMTYAAAAGERQE